MCILFFETAGYLERVVAGTAGVRACAVCVLWDLFATTVRGYGYNTDVWLYSWAACLLEADRVYVLRPELVLETVVQGLRMYC